MPQEHPHFKNVLETYRLHAHLLEQKKADHFSLRAYSATGDPAFIVPCQSIAIEKRKKIPFLINGLKNQLPYFIPTSLQETSVNARRKKKRQDYYLDHPQLPLFHDLTNDLFVLARLDAVTGFEVTFREGCDLLASHQTESHLLCTNEAIRLVSSYSANVIYHLKRLGVTNLTSQYLHTIKNLLSDDYAEPKHLAEPDLYSAYYTLTHVIIAASDYYDHAPIGNFSFIFDYFEKHLETALSRLSLDILTEIALCYRLCGNDTIAFQKLRDHVDRNFTLDPNSSPQILSEKEHTASLIMLLFSPIETFASGPHLSC